MLDSCQQAPKRDGRPAVTTDGCNMHTEDSKIVERIMTTRFPSNKNYVAPLHWYTGYQVEKNDTWVIRKRWFGNLINMGNTQVKLKHTLLKDKSSTGQGNLPYGRCHSEESMADFFGNILKLNRAMIFKFWVWLCIKKAMSMSNVL